MDAKTVILMDTREKIAHKGHILEAFRRNGIKCERTKLYVGDYTLPADQSTCIDVKQGLQEVYSNLIHDHARFRAECMRAIDAKIRLVVLIEEPGIDGLRAVASWQNPREAEYNAAREQIKAGALLPDQCPKGPPVSSSRLSRLMRTMTELYRVEWLFCSPEQTGEKIIEILANKNAPHWSARGAPEADLL